MLSYLIHIKDVEKHQYDPEEVVTITGQDYQEIFAEIGRSGCMGRAKKTAKTAKWAQMNSKPDFRRFSYAQVILSDNYQVYASRVRPRDKAFNVYAERKVYKTTEGWMRRFSFKLLFSLKVNHGVVKALFTDLLSKQFNQLAKNENGLNENRLKQSVR